MGFVVFTALSIVLTVGCLYCGQVLGSQRTVGAWGGFFLALLLGPIGLLAILLFPKVPDPQRVS